jgi:hypothetical protein
MKTTQMSVVNAIRRGVQLASAGAMMASLQNSDVVELVEGFSGVDSEADGAIIVGIGGGRHPTMGARTIFDAYLRAGKHVIFIDKGYTRADTFRVVANGFQPKYLMSVNRPLDRLHKSRISVQPFDKKRGDAILFDGASNKYCVWCGLPTPDKPDQQEWGRQVIAKIKQHTDRPVIYRPRPSHNLPIPIEGAELSTRPLNDDLARAHVVVSHGGNIGFDAIVAGKPHFMIKESIAWPVSETDWNNLDTPYVPTTEKRQQWLANVRYSEWTLDELNQGIAWPVIRQQLFLTF